MRGVLEDYLSGPLAPFITDGGVVEAGSGTAPILAESAPAVLALHRLQFEEDYRAALQGWFGGVAPGGYLIVVVSHAFLFERQLALPSRWYPDQRRLYTPRSLMEEVEEALAPNSYRLRLLRDDDAGYDYALSSQARPVGASDILLVLEKIAAPDWALEVPVVTRAAEPDYMFDPPRTRVETLRTRPPLKILLMKLDHLGDFILSIAALRRARAVFADAEITLVVGSWNAGMADALGVADRVVAFDAFPPNSTEAEVDVAGKAALFGRALPDAYDLAIDLRTDHDTRPLLRQVRAGLRAGIGTRARFPFLDIFLPIDASRNEPETAREFVLNHHAFKSQGSAGRSEYRITSQAETMERDCAILWGPYHRLPAGRYLFEPHLELGPDHDGGVLMLDVALDTRRVAQLVVPSSERRLAFRVDQPEAEFEFRIWAVDDLPGLDLSFFGGRLIRAGAASVLHQSEYQSLLVELVAMRTARTGMLRDVDGDGDAP